MARRTLSREELGWAVIWEALRADYYKALGPHYSALSQECRMLSEAYSRRLESLDQEAA